MFAALHTLRVAVATDFSITFVPMYLLPFF